VKLNIYISLWQNAYDQEKDIAQRSYTTPHRALGIHENPAVIYKTKYTHLVTKIQTLAQLMSAQSITL
jgi:hypothetical protein